MNRKKIAVIGTGISGLSAAWMLNDVHDVTVFEKNEYLGGHSRTYCANVDGQSVDVDTGFIVYNERNYPLLTRLFEFLQVPTAPSDMSFGVSIDKGWMEYGTRKPTSLFAQSANLLRPQFWGMLLDILRFNAKARNYLTADSNRTLGQCLDDLGMGQWCRDYYLMAMGGAIWSTPTKGMLDFPAQTFVRFFDNHGLLTINDHPKWRTVQGGSKSYVARLSEPFRDRIRLNCGVVSVQRSGDKCIVMDTTGAQTEFDHVVFGCHSDQALGMIRDPSSDETAILGAFQYQPNRAVLHRDISFMPKRKSAWSSWIYLSDDRRDQNRSVSLSYWMNNLQPLKTDTPIIVTLNPGREPDPALVYDDHWFEHPVFNTAAIAAQSELHRIQGADKYWFCGAYQRYGFHEDGLLSAVNMIKAMGITPSWI